MTGPDKPSPPRPHAPVTRSAAPAERFAGPEADTTSDASGTSGNDHDGGCLSAPTGPARAGADLAAGIAAIKAAVKTAPGDPGVYRMLDAKGDVLYVGKAKSIVRRVTSYTQPNRQSNRILRMIALTRSMIFVTTHTEAEALLLESNLIKRHRPPFNVVLRDDKSFPYILLREDHDWAQIRKHRGPKRHKGVYYGPFASAGAVNRTLNTLQKVFLLRSCTDAVLDSRTRPCLLYQIKRCSAPCVGRIDAAGYAELVAEARAFLAGRETRIQKQLAERMEAAAEALDFETAAMYRDRLRALTTVQARQAVNAENLDAADVIALAVKGGQTCIQVFFYRQGQNWGNRAYFPRHEKGAEPAEVLSAFLGQFYDDKEPPQTLLLSREPEDAALLQEALSVRAERRVALHVPKRGEKRTLVDDALRNAEQALDRRLAESASQARLLDGVADAFGLDAPPKRLEIYDNSHTGGTNAIGGMVVAGPEGFEKNQYRTFNIKSTELTPGDDFAMMKEVLTRRFSRLMKEDPERAGATWPDLLVIDGGKGQLSAVMAILEDLGVEDVAVVAVSKGPDRHAGREEFHLPGAAQPIRFRAGDPVLYYMQRLRDEAHRFAIGGHRQRRAKALVKNPLDEIPGIGAKRKKALLLHFGSAKAVAQAGVRDLAAVDGVSHALAQAIYDHFHERERP
ncbi:excinuclease ABC subunit C [Rhodothalassium salexigens DSM 2132]|uniref:UvrABC system protein C n=1 Tax=Rhodothalassium salexigens DSM 2132 TaxID=1188247 RepID=A0A4R2PEA9_RHOSA|nr:excinuclease ABC subunit C [Rhodothalassium salexigens DSM 2132]TCP33467.1 excinuclease ABC subunit C [Rhodothalassium salexigens DSM 2132]